MSGVDGRRTLWRTVLPVADADAVLPLYLEVGDHTSPTILGRGAVRVPAGGRVSFGTYFNAFPAAYWRRDTDVEVVRLTVSTDGAGTVELWRSDAEGVSSSVERREIDGDATTMFEVPLAGFRDGGAVWFDLAAGATDVVLREADWSATSAAPAGRATVGVPTFNRPEDCLAQLTALASDAELAGAVDLVVVVDQGERSATELAGFAAVADRLGERLRIVQQPNLGGSGGFSRAMLESLGTGSDYVILLDDDATAEPESLLRAMRFADHAREDVIVGGGMLHADDRAVLYAQAEQWDDRIGWVRLGREGAYDHDFARVPFRRAPFFHRLHRADFNGWWMCLVPVRHLRAHGLSWPLFLKGDDIEFARRAREHGVATVSVPGIAVWHLGWGGKAPTRTWEAYFLHRNRLIGELLHNPRRRPVAFLLHSLLGDLKPLFSLHYGAVRLRHLAAEDALRGPDPLAGWLRTRLGEVRALWATYPEAQPVDPSDPVIAAVLAEPAVFARARGAVTRAALLGRLVLRHLVVPASADSRRAPQAHLAVADPPAFARLDSALVDTPDGTGAVWLRRSRRETARAVRRSLALHTRLLIGWPRLARTYRDAAPRATSPASWADTFAR